jgi:hypothetical protein
MLTSGIRAMVSDWLHDVDDLEEGEVMVVLRLLGFYRRGGRMSEVPYVY